jgi:hypothetical protein
MPLGNETWPPRTTHGTPRYTGESRWLGFGRLLIPGRSWFLI